MVLALGAAVLGSRFVDDSPAPAQTNQAGLVRFEDKRAGLSISYPASWPRTPSSDPEVSLLAGTAEASMSMRTAPLGAAVGKDDLENAKNLTDKLVAKARQLQQLRPPRLIEDLGGLRGWLYIYSFKDSASGQRGAHAHYFLFRGKELITLVFQTVPSEQFTTYAPVFDRLAGTFEAKMPDEDSSSAGDA